MKRLPDKDDIYGELEDGLTFLLTPPWLKGWEEDEIRGFEENEKEVKSETK